MEKHYVNFRKQLIQNFVTTVCNITKIGFETDFF